MADEYPPHNHILRDLGVSLEFQGQGRAVIRAPVVPEIRTEDGSLQIGAVATMIDVLGGGMTIRAVHPDWMAAGKSMETKDLAVQYLSQGKRGPFRTRTRVLRVTDDTALTRVEVIDRGLEDRLIAVVMNTAVAHSRV